MDITCPKCGKAFRIEVLKVSRLEAEVKDLRATIAALKVKLKEAQGMASLGNIFGGFK